MSLLPGHVSPATIPVPYGLSLAPLALVSIPGSGYLSFVQATLGHVYVARAHVGQKGHHIVFRVTEMGKTSVTFDWLYRRCRGQDCERLELVLKAQRGT